MSIGIFGSLVAVDNPITTPQHRTLVEVEVYDNIVRIFIDGVRTSTYVGDQVILIDKTNPLDIEGIDEDTLH